MSDTNSLLRRKRLTLPDATTYDVGYAKPPVASRFEPGHSGNSKGRPKGARNKVPALHEARGRAIIMEEAFRTIPIVEKGRRVSIPMFTAVVRALTMNAAKGNNRAATILTGIVQKIEQENNELSRSYFASAVDYKMKWDAELQRRQDFGLNLPDPVPHPDDMVLNARTGEVHIKGPMTEDEKNLWAFAADYLPELERQLKSKERKLRRDPLHPDRWKLKREIKKEREQFTMLKQHFGPRHERSLVHTLREYQRLKKNEK